MVLSCVCVVFIACDALSLVVVEHYALALSKNVISISE